MPSPTRSPARRSCPRRTLPALLLMLLLVTTGAGLGGVLIGGPGTWGVNGARSHAGQLHVAVLPGPSAPSITVGLATDRNTVVQNHAFNLTVTLSPTPAPSDTLRWTGLPSSCTAGAPATATVSPIVWGCTPTQTGPFSIYVNATNGTGASGQSPTVSVSVVSQLSVSLSLSPATVSANSPVTVNYQVNGGISPYSLNWIGLPNPCMGAAPSTDPDSSSHTFSCTPTQSGTSQIQLQATDSASPSQTFSSNSQTLTVKSSSNGNNGGNNGSGHNNNSNGSFQLPAFFSNLGSLLALFLLAGIVAFVLLIITAVSTLITAIVVARRLPPRSKGESKGAPTMTCPACGKPASADAAFCPSCGKPMSGPKAT